MNANIIFEKREGYLYSQIVGNYNFTDTHQLINLIMKECQKNKICRILINALNLSGTNVSFIERFSLGKEVADAFRFNYRIAVVWPGKDITKFAETVAVNRGATVNVVDNEDKALNWLMAGDNI